MKMNIFDDAQKRIEEEAARVTKERDKARKLREKTLKKFSTELNAYLKKNKIDVPIDTGSETVKLGTDSDGISFTLEGQKEFRVKHLTDQRSLTPDKGKFEAPKSLADSAEAAVQWLQRKKNA